MTTENNDAQLGRRVTDLEREVGALRQRVTELERVTASAAAIEPLAMPAMDIGPLDFASTASKPPAAPVTAPKVAAPAAVFSAPVVRPMDMPPPLPVAAPLPPIYVPPPPPRPPVVPQVVVPSAPDGPSPLRLFLERLQLWPPSGDQNREASLGTWWATRVGTLLLVIGVVFLGVYVSRNTPPWVRFAELLGVSIGISAFGLWLERKIERFGAVLFGGGLALLYFCAFAAYMVDAMRVIESPLVAAGWQLVAVAVLSGAAVWRRSPVVATMAVAMGFVTALFSRGDGLPGFALGSTVLLGLAAVFFHRRWKWEAPAFVAMPATYFVGALILSDAWRAGTEPPRGWTWLFLVGALALYFCRDWRGTRTTAASMGLAEKAFQGLNSTFAVAVGVGAALIMYPAHLAEFYFGAAAVLGGLSLLRRLQVEGDSIGAVLLAKAAGALTLGVIETVEGRTTAIALLVQAWVMLFAAWRMKSRVLEWGTAVVAGVASWFFLRDVGEPVHLVSLAAAGSAVFVAGLALLASEMARRLFASEGQETRRAIELLGAIAAGILALQAADHWLPSEWNPAMLTGLAVILALAAILRRVPGPAIAGILPLAAANLALWDQALGVPGGTVLGWNALVVLAPLAVAGAWVGGRRTGWPLQALAGGFRALGAGLWAVGVVGLVLVFFNLWPDAWALLGTACVALALAACATRWPERYLTWVATWAVTLGVGWWWLHGADVVPTAALVGAAAALWALAISAEAWPQFRAALQRDRGAACLSAFQVAAATFVSVRTLMWLVPIPLAPLAFAIAALVVGALVLRPGLHRALEASWVFWAFAWMAFDRLGWLEASTAMQPGLLAAGLLAWLPVVVVARSAHIRDGWINGQTWWRAAEPIQNVIAVFISVRVASVIARGATELWILIGAALFALVAARVARSVVPQVSAMALAGWAAAQSFVRIGAGDVDDGSAGLVAVLAVAALLAALPFALERGDPRLDRPLRRGLGKLLAAAGALLAFYAIAAQDGALAPYITVGWGLVACGLFLAGLIARSRPHRLLGLVGLALCVGRVFVVDLNSTLHRIIAFVVVGAVLLGVGFSYQKFRHLIVEDDGDDEAKAKEEES